MDGEQSTGAESCSWPRTVSPRHSHPIDHPAPPCSPPGGCPSRLLRPASAIRNHPSARSGGLVAQSAVAPPGPIPNPVVTHRSAGEYCGVAPREARPLRAPPIWRTRWRIARYNRVDRNSRAQCAAVFLSPAVRPEFDTRPTRLSRPYARRNVSNDSPYATTDCHQPDLLPWLRA